MAQQVVIAGALFNDVPSISVPDSNNVWHPFLDTTIASNAAAASDIAQGKLAYVNGSLVTGTNQGGGGGDSWSWMGKNPTKITTFDSGKVYFKDTAFATWTYKTTASTMVASTSYSPTMALDKDNYDYVQLVKMYSHYDYGNWAPVAAERDFCFMGTRYVSGYCSNVSAAQSATPNYAGEAPGFNLYYAYYWNTSGKLAYSAQAYGVYATAMTAVSIASASTTPVATWKSPEIIMRGNASYFSSTAYSNLNMNNSYYQLVTEIWRVDAGTSDRSNLLGEIVSSLNNGGL